MKRVKFTKGRHIVGHGAFEPGDEVPLDDKLASQLVAQDVVEYVEVAKPRKMVEDKTEVKVVEMKLHKKTKSVDKYLDIDKATD